MAKRSTPPLPLPKPPLNLSVTMAEAESQINARLEKGKSLLNLQISTIEEYKDVRNQFYTWSEYNQEMLRRLFTNNEIAAEYHGFAADIISFRTLAEQISDLHEDIKDKIRKLESIRERLDIIPPVVQNAPKNIALKDKTSSDRVFIVHGHDNYLREAVARFLESNGFIPVVLHEQADGGRTLIEKVEANSDVGFAIILLTADDIGAPKDKQDQLSPRARQNVIFEWGLFIGVLGRAKTCAIYDESVELPSDLQGIVRIAYDKHEAWKLGVARELRHAGFNIDLNNLG